MRRTVAALLVSAFAAAGCGGDDGSLSAEEYRDRGNAICQRSAAEVADLDPPIRKEDVADWLARAFEITLDSNDELAALEPPPDLRKLHERVTGGNERARRAAAKVVERVRKSDDPARLVLALVKLLLSQPESERTTAAMRKLGLDACAEGFDPTRGRSAPT